MRRDSKDPLMYSLGHAAFRIVPRGRNFVQARGFCASQNDYAAKPSPLSDLLDMPNIQLRAAHQFLAPNERGLALMTARLLMQGQHVH